MFFLKHGVMYVCMSDDLHIKCDSCRSSSYTTIIEPKSRSHEQKKNSAVILPPLRFSECMNTTA